MKRIKFLHKEHDSSDRLERPDLPSDLEMSGEFEDDRELMDDDLRQLVQQIREMPDVAPPAELLPAVMQTLRRQRQPWWRRAARWIGSPRSFRLSYLQLAAAAAVLLLAPSLVTFYLSGPGGRNVSQIHQPARIPVEFTLHLQQAQSVAVIGTFNDWHPQGYQMRETAKDHGTWTLTLWLGAGRYEYSFLVNGRKIMADPRSTFYEDDGFGNRNAVLIVGNGDDKSI